MPYVHRYVAAQSGTFDVRIWLDPVCPFSWNTARWLDTVAGQSGLLVDWQLMNLAVLNEGRELPPAQQARMDDSRQVGRLMTGIYHELGQRGLYAAYFAFGELYFDESVPVGARRRQSGGSGARSSLGPEGNTRIVIGHLTGRARPFLSRGRAAGVGRCRRQPAVAGEGPHVLRPCPDGIAGTWQRASTL